MSGIHTFMSMNVHDSSVLLDHHQLQEQGKDPLGTLQRREDEFP